MSWHISSKYHKVIIEGRLMIAKLRRLTPGETETQTTQGMPIHGTWQSCRLIYCMINCFTELRKKQCAKTIDSPISMLRRRRRSCSSWISDKPQIGDEWMVRHLQDLCLFWIQQKLIKSHIHDLNYLSHKNYTMNNLLIDWWYFLMYLLGRRCVIRSFNDTLLD